MEPHQIDSLNTEFQTLDTDNSGFLEKDELREAIKKSSFALEVNEVDDIINQLDLAKNGKINYSEFLSATIDINQMMTQQKIMSLFKTFDINNDG